MELTAALLHSPDVLFLDEPTIGLDVVAQYNIQDFLKHYQRERGITTLLTSHYMKDVAALCRRVVIITHGRIMFDGSLSQIIDRFGGHKVVTLLFADGHIPGDLGVYGEVLSAEPPRAKVRVERGRRHQNAGRILQQHPVEDVSVEDPPLEEMIAEIFSQVNEAVERNDARADCRAGRLVCFLALQSGGRSCESASKNGWSIGAISLSAR